MCSLLSFSSISLAKQLLVALVLLKLHFFFFFLLTSQCGCFTLKMLKAFSPFRFMHLRLYISCEHFFTFIRQVLICYVFIIELTIFSDFSSDIFFHLSMDYLEMFYLFFKHVLIFRLISLRSKNEF